MKIKKVALIGMGAVGTVYGNLLYNKYGSDLPAYGEFIDMNHSL